MTEREERDTARGDIGSDHWRYFVTYYVTFEVEARTGAEAREKAEAELLEALKEGTIGDYISEDSSAEVA
jgi:hypothetical protein